MMCSSAMMFSRRRCECVLPASSAKEPHVALGRGRRARTVSSRLRRSATSSTRCLIFLISSALALNFVVPARCFSTYYRRSLRVHSRLNMVKQKSSASLSGVIVSGPQSQVYFDDDDDDTDTSNLINGSSSSSEECYIDDMDQHGELCIVSDTDSSFPATRILSTNNIEIGLRYIPILAPILAFLTYEGFAGAFDWFIEALSDRNWVAVDGGQFQAQIITPAVNGIVVPAIALLFATLISNTINTLRQRQSDIRTTLNTEAGELRTLQSMVDCFPSDIVEQMHLREYLIQYTSRLIAESRPGVNIAQLEFTGSTDSEMNGFMVKLNELSVMAFKSKDGSGAGVIPPSLLSECYGAVTRLYAERSSRISALQSVFPVLHYVILTILAASICIVFLMESDQALLIFLNAVQLRILWSMLIGTFSALAVVSYDLEDPFRGSYQITASIDQFYTIRDALRASSKLDAKLKEEENDDDKYDSDMAFL